MKLQRSLSGCRPRPAASAGFTLMELLIAVFIFVVLMLGGTIFLHVHGLKMFQITETKLNVLTWSRETVGRLTEEVRSSADVQIGNMDTTGWVGRLPGETQQGNAILIVTANANNSITTTNTYFVNPSNQLVRVTDPPASTVILAESVTNTQPFSLQTFKGEVLTNSANNGVIHVLLEFYQPGRYLQGVDYYKLETSVSRRVVPQK